MNLILGTANFCKNYGKRLERDECFKILDRAKELGITTVATAFDYGSDVVKEYGWKDVLHKPRPGVIEWMGRVGITVDTLDEISATDLLMAPFNPLNYSFVKWVSCDGFIARSIFVGGKVYGNAERTLVARLTFGFLRSHEIKNVVFGVDSIEELEINVEAARDVRVYDTRYI